MSRHASRLACSCLLLGLLLSGCGESSGIDARAGKAGQAGAKELALSCEGFPSQNANGSITICEVREFADLPALDTVSVRASSARSPAVTGVSINPTDEQPKSSIRAVGRERTTVTLRAYVYATGADEQAARDIAAEIVVHADDNDFFATGPDGQRISAAGNRRSDWAVSFDVEMPGGSNLRAVTTDGALLAEDLASELTLESSTGDIELNRINGSVLAGNSSGNIVGRDLDGSQNLSTSTGELRVERLTGASLLGTSSGPINAVGLDGDNRLTSSTGDVLAERLSGTSTVETSSGAVTAADLSGDSRIVVSTGTVQLSRAEGRTVLDTGSALLTAEDLQGETEFASSSGDVSLRRVAGALRGQSSSGQIELDLEGPGYEGSGVELSSSSGNISLRVPSDYSASFNFVTSNGTIRSDFSGNSSSGPARYTETLGAGGATISAETSSGDISLVRK